MSEISIGELSARLCIIRRRVGISTRQAVSRGGLGASEADDWLSKLQFVWL